MSDGRSRSGLEVEDLIEARYPLIYIVSSEEERVEKALREIGAQARAQARGMVDHARLRDSSPGICAAAT